MILNLPGHEEISDVQNRLLRTRLLDWMNLDIAPEASSEQVATNGMSQLLWRPEGGIAQDGVHIASLSPSGSAWLEVAPAIFLAEEIRALEKASEAEELQPNKTKRI